jgi:hypothetical protein
MVFAIIWCCIGLNVFPALGNPPKPRLFYLILGLIHIPVLVVYVARTNPKRMARNR